MDMSKLSQGQMIAGVGGIVLIVSLFLDWISTPFGGGTAFDVFSGMDIIMLLIGVAAVAYAALPALGSAGSEVDPVCRRGRAGAPDGRKAERRPARQHRSAGQPMGGLDHDGALLSAIVCRCDDRDIAAPAQARAGVAPGEGLE